MMAIPPPYHDSDADDEYERSVLTSPLDPTDDETSPIDTDPPSAEPTPTGFGHQRDTLPKASPSATIVGWTNDQCADYISSINLPQYCETFLENEIVGEALIALRHDELKEMGIMSVGHRLTILKGVFDMKQRQGIPMDSDHWMPPSAEAAVQDQTATRDDLSRIIRSLELRDHRIQAAEAEIRKVTEEYRRLRDELLPVFRMAKDRSQPLPYHPNNQSVDVHGDESTASPTSAQLPPETKPGTSSLLSRKFSTKRLFLGGNTPKSISPTHAPPFSSADNRSMMAEVTTLDPSAAAIAASNHLNAGLSGVSQQSASPNQINIPSPTSPNVYATYAPSSRNHPPPPLSAARSNYSHNMDDLNYASPAYSDRDRDRTNPALTPKSASKAGPLSSSSIGPSMVMPSSQGPTITIPSLSSSLQQPLSSTTLTSTSSPFQQQPQDDSASTGGGSGVEIFKSFRVSLDDPCEKVLPAALRKYNINADWKNYALYILYGDQERCLGLREKPLILFKQLDREGKKPMFMLRKHAAPLEGHSGPTGGSGGAGGRGESLGGYDGGGLGSSRSHVNSIQLPGGVI